MQPVMDVVNSFASAIDLFLQKNGSVHFVKIISRLSFNL